MRQRDLDLDTRTTKLHVFQLEIHFKKTVNLFESHANVKWPFMVLLGSTHFSTFFVVSIIYEILLVF